MKIGWIAQFLSVTAAVFSPMAGCDSTTSSMDSGPVDASSHDAGVVSTDSAPEIDATVGEGSMISNLTYLSVAGLDLAGDLYLPPGEGPFPAVVIVHGGAFASGDKEGHGQRTWGNALVDNGIAAFSINYRLNANFSGTGGNFPEPVKDIKCAIQWLRSQASAYHLSDQIFIFGSSTGGYYANFIGVTGDELAFAPASCPGADAESNRVAGAISYFGISDWTRLASDDARQPDGLISSERQFVGSSCTTMADQLGICAEASPASYLDASDPPFFITHSSDDPAIPVTQSRFLSSELEGAGVDVQYVEISGQGHGWFANFSNPAVAMVRDQVLTFIATHSVDSSGNL